MILHHFIGLETAALVTDNDIHVFQALFVFFDILLSKKG